MRTSKHILDFVTKEIDRLMKDANEANDKLKRGGLSPENEDLFKHVKDDSIAEAMVLLKVKHFTTGEFQKR
jgi:hypothetical protein